MYIYRHRHIYNHILEIMYEVFTGGRSIIIYIISNIISNNNDNLLIIIVIG